MSTKKTKEPTKPDFPFKKENYTIMAIGFVVIIIGFIFMTGGKPDSPDKFSYDIFSFTRITLAPVLVILGFLIEIYAIMKKPKEKETT
jgi:hypothetical protein